MGLASNQLEAFYAVARNWSFTKAAEELGITQSALSQRVSNLEEELGTALFIRDRAGLRLTEVAQSLIHFCRTKNHLEEEFLSNLKSRDRITGIIRIAGFSSVMRSVVLPALTPMLKKHPQVQLQFQIKEMHELLLLLKTGEADFIISHEEYEREEIESHLLGTEVSLLVEAKDYKGPDIYLDHDDRDRTTIDYLRMTKTKVGKVQRRYLEDIYGLIDGVKLGLGRAILPVHLIKQEKSLKIIDPKKSLSYKVFLHHYRQPFYSKFQHLIVKELMENSASLFE